MKKLLAMMAALMVVFGASAKSRVVYDDSALPANARQTLTTHFKSKVNHVKIDTDMFGKVDDYDVVLKNGTEVGFDASGNLKDVEAGANGVPSSLVLPAVLQYVKQNCGGKKIVQLDIDKKYYEVELIDGRELTFDRSGNFIKEDR